MDDPTEDSVSQSTQDGAIRRLLSDALRIPIEQRVSDYLGRAWRVVTAESKSEEASHHAAILSDDTHAVFVKLGEGDLAKDQFTRPEHFREMEKARLGRFLEARDRWDPQRKVRSRQSERLFGDRAAT